MRTFHKSYCTVLIIINTVLELNVTTYIKWRLSVVILGLLLLNLLSLMLIELHLSMRCLTAHYPTLSISFLLFPRHVRTSAPTFVYCNEPNLTRSLGRNMYFKPKRCSTIYANFVLYICSYFYGRITMLFT